MILFYTTSIIVISILFVNLFVSVKQERLIYANVLILTLLPSSRVLGFSNSSAINIPPSYLYILTVIPIMIIIFNSKFLKINTIKYYNLNIGFIFISLISIILFQTMYFNGLNSSIFKDFLNQSYIVICLSILTYFFYCLFKELSSKNILDIFLNILLYIGTIASFFGLLFYLSIPMVQDFQRIFYEFKFTGIDGSIFSLTDQAIKNNRPYSIFSSANQYGIFATFLSIPFTYLFLNRSVAKSKYYFVLLISVIIAITSQSRTALILLILTNGVLILRGKSTNRKLIFAFVILLCAIILPLFIPERVEESFSMDKFIVLIFDQRIDHWQSFFSTDLTYSILFAGIVNEALKDGFLKLFESGHLNIIARYGLVFFIIYSLIYYKNYKYSEATYQNKHMKKMKNIISYSIVILFLSEVFQGTLFTLRYEFIFSIYFSIALVLTENEKINHKYFRLIKA